MEYKPWTSNSIKSIDFCGHYMYPSVWAFDSSLACRNINLSTAIDIKWRINVQQSIAIVIHDIDSTMNMFHHMEIHAMYSQVFWTRYNAVNHAKHRQLYMRTCEKHIHVCIILTRWSIHIYIYIYICVILTRWGLMVPHGVGDLGQHWIC